MPVFSYLSRNGKTLRVPIEGPDPQVPEYLLFDGERHYVLFAGAVPDQDPAIDLRVHDLDSEPALWALLKERAEPVLRARAARRDAYPAVGDQLDAVLAEFAERRRKGDRLTQDLDALVDRWLAVKLKHPKPDLARKG